MTRQAETDQPEPDQDNKPENLQTYMYVKALSKSIADVEMLL